MRRNPFAVTLTLLALLTLPALGVPAHATCMAGHPDAYSVESTPDSDFASIGNEIVVHNKTGLWWKACAEGQTWTGSNCAGTPSSLNWSDALKAAVASTAGFNTDWRLPNKKELESIVESCGYNPAFNQDAFPDPTHGNFWSSTSLSTNAALAWGVGFGDGGNFAGSKSDGNYVRLVRSGIGTGSYDRSHPTANVFYNGNGNTGGSAPADNFVHAPGANVNVLGNTGNLVKMHYRYTGWNTVAGGGGTAYGGGDSLTMGSANIILYAQWTALISSDTQLSNLVVSGTPLSPAFASGTLAYTGSVPHSTTSVTVTPTLMASTSTVTVNGVQVANGGLSGAISLVQGSNIIDIVVTAQDGTTQQTYTVTVTRLPPVADLTVTSTHRGNFVRGREANYVLQVSNVGSADTSGMVTVTDTLPPGLTATGLYNHPTGWNCALNTVTCGRGVCVWHPLTCARSDVLMPGYFYPDIVLRVNVARDAAASLSNSATVSGGGDTSPGNNTFSDPTRTIINMTPILELLLFD